MTSLPKQVVLHLGAHKTATTHLQRSIRAAALPDVAMFGPPELRDRGQTLPERFGFPLDTQHAAMTAMAPADMLSAMAAGACRLYLSDENFAGKIQIGWGRIPTPLYRTAPHRVAALAEKLANTGAPLLDLCLGIRDPAGYLTSIYSQILHGKRVVKPEKYVAKNPVPVVDWADYVGRLRAVPGVGAITIWRYEDHATLFGDICNALVGTDTVAPLPERMQSRLSQQALDAVLLAKSLGSPNMVAEAAVAFPVTGQSPPLTLYNAEAQALSTALYAQQCGQIAEMDGVTFLRPR